MEKLREDHGYITVRRGMRFLSIRLHSRPLSAGLAVDIDKERDALNERNEAYENAFEERVAASAEIGFLDGMLGSTVSDLARDVNALVKGRTDDPRYLRVFIGTPSERMKPVGGAEQDRFVQNILDVLARDPDFASLSAHAPLITEWQQQLSAAFKRRESLQLAEDRARQELDIAIARARKTYNQMEHRLALIFPDHESLVESFFRATRAAGVVEAPAEPQSAPAPVTVTHGAQSPANENAVGAVQAPANENAQAPARPQTRRTRRRRVA
jgi:hypothetical protein